MTTVTFEVRGTMRTNEPMSKHTVWAVGGPAEFFFEPADEDDLAMWLASDPSHGEQLFWLGLGSNLLVRDGGIKGTVIHTTGKLGVFEHLGGTDVRVGAGVPCAKVARELTKLGLGGCEFLAGIPGTIGGALAMNAGAHGGETWDFVTRIRCVDASGVLRWREPSDFEVSYRSVRGKEKEWFTACELRLEHSDEKSVREAVKALLAHRAATQPTGMRSCGSVFRNPPGDYAGRLIEAASLKETRRGGALVSAKHANFILNDGGATADDLEELIDLIQVTVKERFGVSLQREVQVVGDYE